MKNSLSEKYGTAHEQGDQKNQRNPPYALLGQHLTYDIAEHMIFFSSQMIAAPVIIQPSSLVES
jgi:hypothetical protein